MVLKKETRYIGKGGLAHRALLRAKTIRVLAVTQPGYRLSHVYQHAPQVSITRFLWVESSHVASFAVCLFKAVCLVNITISNAVGKVFLLLNTKYACHSLLWWHFGLCWHRLSTSMHVKDVFMYIDLL